MALTYSSAPFFIDAKGAFRPISSAWQNFFLILGIFVLLLSPQTSVSDWRAGQKRSCSQKNSFFLLAIKQRVGMITVIRVSVAGKLKRTSVLQIHDLEHLQNRIAFFSFQIVDVFLRCFFC